MKGTQDHLSDIVEIFTEAAIAAGSEILRRRKERLNATQKADGSPVTDADLRAEEIIRARLLEALPGVPIIGEEGDGSTLEAARAERFVLVDPLDGTRDFLDGSAHFTVNIALIENRRSVAGVLYAPACGRLFEGNLVNGAYEIAVPSDGFAAKTPLRRTLHVRPAPASNPLALESRSHREPATESLLARLGPFERRAVGSSLKFGLIAAGEGDLYARGVSLNEWDIAAGDAVLSAAGGAVITFGDEPVLYGNPDLKAPPFIAVGDQALRTRVQGSRTAETSTE
ncbi:MAG: 3'(2'),5'-bisphosphate nucleotidase CysQ [Hyphomicrobiales bacterium]|nr:3'(2'),5'-bisphosphate nucleotidase CysQ [Hyphomicrobiales bacterium]